MEWIKECITSSRLSVHVNGAPTGEFSPQRGLRQGDSLSPFLVNIAAEGLSILLSRALDMDLIKGVKIGAGGVVLTHLQVADDSILLCEAEVLEVKNLKRILRCFELLSGLRINYHKSVVSGVGVSVESMNEFASVLNCKVKRLPIKYLGLPFGANPSRKATWRPVLDKVRTKLVGWKMRLLSFAGRFSLIKSVLFSLPMYYLSLYKMPQGVARELDKLQALFLWGGFELRKKVHLVKWKEVSKPVDQRGLGVRRVNEVNACLLLKWWWRFGVESKALWRRVICSKYRVGKGNWWPSDTFNSRCSTIWKDIVIGIEQNSSLIVFFSRKL